MFQTIKTTALITTALASLTFVSNANADITWKPDRTQGVQSAQETNKPILVFVTADWCHYCQKMKRQTWSNQTVAATVNKDFVPVLIDGDRQRAEVSRLQVRGFPTTFVFAPDGKVLGKRTGYMSPAETKRWLDSLPKPKQRIAVINRISG